MGNKPVSRSWFVREVRATKRRGSQPASHQGPSCVVENYKNSEERKTNDSRDGSPLEGGGPELSCESQRAPGWVEGSGYFRQWQQLWKGWLFLRLKMRSPYLLPSSPPLHCCLLADLAFLLTFQASAYLGAFALAIPSARCPLPPDTDMASFLSVSAQMSPSEKPSLTMFYKIAASHHHIYPVTLLVFFTVNIIKYITCFSFYHLCPLTSKRVPWKQGLCFVPIILNM